MCTRALVLLLILDACISPVFATEVVSIENNFGNVKTRIFTDIQHEYEWNKVYIIGELARRLAVELNYTKPLLLDFRCPVGGRDGPDYLVSFDDGAIPERAPKPVLASPGIVIRQGNRPLDGAVTLALLEYAIRNVDRIQSEQHLHTYGNQRVSSIDYPLIQEVLGRPLSPAIERVWQTRVMGPGTKPAPKNLYGVGYYFEKGLFVIYCWNQRSGEAPLLSLRDMYDFKEVSRSRAVVFDTDKSFYHIDAIDAKCSPRHVIEDTHDFTECYDVVPLGGDKIAICFSYFVSIPPGERTAKRNYFGVDVKYRVVVYHSGEDKLIQDLDTVLDEQKPKASEASGTAPKD